MSIVVVVALGRSQAGFWADSVSQQFLSVIGLQYLAAQRVSDGVL